MNIHMHPQRGVATVWGILILVAVAVVGGYFVISAIPEEQLQDRDMETSTSTDEQVGVETHWETYTNEAYGFTIDHPAHWRVSVTNQGDIFPAINIYPADAEITLPLTHHSGVTQVSVFPEGVPTEGIFGERRTAAVSVGEAVREANEYVLSDGTPWGAFIYLENAPRSWNGSGFIWASDEIDSLVVTCLRAGEEIPQAQCDPLTSGDTVVRDGIVDNAQWEIIAEMLASLTTFDTGLSTSENIRVANLEEGDLVTGSPLVVRGEARGLWFFEASFPLMLTDWDGRIIGEGFATADGEWMTEEFVPFEGEVAFDLPETLPSNRGTFILQRANPSGLPENAAALEIPIRFDS